MLVAFRAFACVALLAALASIPAVPELAGVFAGLALAVESARLWVAFTGARL
jgi:hypothetical protein